MAVSYLLKNHAIGEIRSYSGKIALNRAIRRALKKQYTLCDLWVKEITDNRETLSMSAEDWGIYEQIVF